MLRCFGEREGFNNKHRSVHHLQLVPHTGSEGGRITLALAYISSKKRKEALSFSADVRRGYPAHIMFKVRASLAFNRTLTPVLDP